MAASSAGCAGVVAILPFAARAQVNIDAGKTAAEIYASDCATCHKTPRGLAAGKNSLTLTIFLREHYTASGDQAKALAAYVLGAGGAEPAPKPKPEIEHARAQEPKPGEPKTAEPKVGEAKPGQPKTAARPVREAAKPDEKRAKDEEARQEQHPAPASAEQHLPETASREPAPKTEEPAPVSAAPIPHETPAVAAAGPAAVTATGTAGEATRSGVLPSLELGSSLDAKPAAEDRPSAAASVPRDRIPD